MKEEDQEEEEMGVGNKDTEVRFSSSCSNFLARSSAERTPYFFLSSAMSISLSSSNSWK